MMHVDLHVENPKFDLTRVRDRDACPDHDRLILRTSVGNVTLYLPVGGSDKLAKQLSKETLVTLEALAGGPKELAKQLAER